MEQARIEHAPNGILLMYITSADALVNNLLMHKGQDQVNIVEVYFFLTIYTFDFCLFV